MWIWVKLIIGQEFDKVDSESTKITYEKGEPLFKIECSNKSNHQHHLVAVAHDRLMAIDWYEISK